MRDAFAVLVLVIALAACGSGGEDRTEARQSDSPSRIDAVESPIAAVTPDTRVYGCDGIRFVARVRPDTAVILLRRSTLRLPRGDGRADDEIRYSDGIRTFRSRGPEARLTLADTTLAGCRADRPASPWREATVRGLEFRALGQEPGWYLEIDRRGGMVMVADYGERRVRAPLPRPVLEREARRVTYHTRAGDHDLRVVIRGELCRDGMSGIPFPTTVVAYLDGDRYRGCGQTLSGPSTRPASTA